VTPSRRLLVLASACALLVPLWAVVAAGLVQVRACVPTSGPFTGAHLLLLRPAAACPSGVALDEHGVFAVVGAVALTTLAVQLAALGAFAGLSAALARTAALVARLVDHVLPGRRTPGRVVAVGARSVLSRATAVLGDVRRAATSVVGLRAPPLAA
jgi:hypothetical protein